MPAGSSVGAVAPHETLLRHVREAGEEVVWSDTTDAVAVAARPGTVDVARKLAGGERVARYVATVSAAAALVTSVPPAWPSFPSTGWAVATALGTVGAALVSWFVSASYTRAGVEHDLAVRMSGRTGYAVTDDALWVADVEDPSSPVVTRYDRQAVFHVQVVEDANGVPDVVVTLCRGEVVLTAVRDGLRGGARLAAFSKVRRVTPSDRVRG